ncbi:MAG: putative transporter ATP-binding protein yojI [Proteobacteria bacterium]|nr:putative transporter ATP-binding protein yojI [Pseudomonadota bacterium]
MAPGFPTKKDNQLNILRLLQTGRPGGLTGALYVTCLAGLANAVLIGLINMAAEEAALGEPVGARLMILYVLAFAIYTLANRASLRRANDFLQHRLGDLRLRLADKIRRSELRTLEGLGRGQLYAIVAQETNHLSQNFPLLVAASQSLFLLVFCLFYIATLSLISFLVVSLVTVIALWLFYSRRAALNLAMTSVHAQEGAMLESLTHFTEGFQEIRLNGSKNDALFARYTRIVDDLQSLVVGIGGKWVILLLFSNAFLYGLLGVVIFVLPGFFSGYTDIIYKIAAAAIFCVGPVTAVTSAAPLFSRASIGLGHAFRLEETLDSGIARQPRQQADVPSRFGGFARIDFVGIGFAYRDAEGAQTFSTGPWDLQLQRGERLFLLGGNGSGKSTALKLMCGLYPVESGRILVDGTPVEASAMQAYRELFAGIFPDFHLFDRLHGLEQVAPERVQALIERMELSDKVSYANGRFSTQDLSTGQRKRLAMIVALLEDREIYFFDEWAADQDAHFRAAFYTEILPELKERGKTVVVVTHDDRFWHLSDRSVSLDLGRVMPAGPRAGEA